MQAGKRKILIVEDEFILYQELVEFFEEKGYSIIGHDSGKAVDTYEEAVQLLKLHEPDIAVLDINIRGKRDGLELASYIKEHFYTLIIILTAYDNHENLERARLLSPDGFVIKADKPVNKKQLWASITVKLPRLYNGDLRKRQGTFFKVREIDLRKTNGRSFAELKANPDPVDIETFIKWENITHLSSYNAKTAGEGNNNILIHTSSGPTAYIYRSPLSDMEKQLPVYFVRFDQSTIVNLHHITAKGRGQTLYFIGDQYFKISDTFKQAALDKISMILGNKF